MAPYQQNDQKSFFVIVLRGQDSNLQPIDYTYLTVSNKGGLYLYHVINDLGISVSSLYGALTNARFPRYYPDINRGLHRYPEKFIFKFPQRAAFNSQSTALPLSYRGIILNFQTLIFIYPSFIILSK